MPVNLNHIQNYSIKYLKTYVLIYKSLIKLSPNIILVLGMSTCNYAFEY